MVTPHGLRAHHLVKTDIKASCWSTSALQALLREAMLGTAKGIGKVSLLVFWKMALAHTLHMLF